jgi:hypothetical protein
VPDVVSLRSFTVLMDALASIAEGENACPAAAAFVALTSQGLLLRLRS